MSGYKSLQVLPGGAPSASPAIQPNKLIINVGGTRFETYKSTLRNIPDTRLAWITESKADNPDYDPASGEYFFDRHPSMFLMILNYYRTGKLHTPSDVCGPAFEEELAFWGIDEKQIESCCWGGYSQHRDAQHTLEELRIDTNFESDEMDADDGQFGSTAEKFGIMESEEHSRSTWEKIKPRMWSILNDRSTSIAAKVFTSMSLVLTIVVIATFVLETHHTCRIPRNSSEIVNRTPFIEYREKTKPHPALYYIEMVCMLELTLETIARLIACPVKKQFFKSALNVFDLISLLSFYITSTMFLIDNSYMEREIFIPLQILRIFRVLRIFKVATHLPALKILFHTLRASAMELMLMLVLIISLILFFASVIYFAEQLEEAEDNHFTSIPIGFWWAIVTMTTLGYGDKFPQTAAGYLVGSLCAICGVLFIALPIPIIVNNFSTYYTHAKAQEKLPKKRKVALVGAADALKQTMQELIPNLNINAPAITSEPSSTEPSPLPNKRELAESAGSKETMKHSDDSGITGSTASAERLTGGINVTFTDIDENEEMRGATSTRHNTASVYGNGHNNLRVTVKDSYIAEEDEEELNDQLIANGNKSKKGSSQSNAISRRASLLPGGVSNAPSSPSPKMLSTKAAAPRERRRSLMPATYVGG